MYSRRLLYVGQAVMHTKKGGPDVINLRNIKLLKSIYGESAFIYEVEHGNKSVFTKLKYVYGLFCGNVCGIKKFDYENILKIIKEEKIDDLFISTSLYGNLALCIKKTFPNVRIISFFHNIEVHYNTEELKISRSLKRLISTHVRNRNELYTVNNSNVIITLNNRDAELLYKIYNRKSDIILPTSFDDHYDCIEANNYSPLFNNKIHLLFVGVNFFANTHGVRWFIENVLKYIPDAHLTIVGREMDKVFENSQQVTVCGYVNDLSHLYYSSDIVILPIFYGAGMKTKTAEALMYGCPVVGSTEAFEGYDFDITEVGAIANTANDMISSIIELASDKNKLLNLRKNARVIFNNLYNSNIYIEYLRERLIM